MAAAATMLGASWQPDPSCRQGIGFVSRGEVNGWPVEVRGSYGADGSGTGTQGISVALKVLGNTYGIVTSAGVRGLYEGTLRLVTRCAPKAVGAAWLDEGVKRALLHDPVVCIIEAERDGIRLGLSAVHAADPQALARAARLGVDMLQRLPSAIGAAGAGQYLASSLDSHPEVIAHRRGDRRQTLFGIALIVTILGVTTAFIIWLML